MSAIIDVLDGNDQAKEFMVLFNFLKQMQRLKEGAQAVINSSWDEEWDDYSYDVEDKLHDFIVKSNKNGYTSEEVSRIMMRLHFACDIGDCSTLNSHYIYLITKADIDQLIDQVKGTFGFYDNE